MLSIIVPVYNASKYLDDCVNSLLAQTYSEFEIILIDDGSRDNSGEICDRYAREYENVRVIHKQNGGVHSARNVGIENCKGDIVALVDADDMIDPQAYEIMINTMLKTGSDVVACGYKTEYGSIHLSRHNTIAQPKIFDGKIECSKGIGNGLQGFIWNKIIRKEKIGVLKFRDDIPICDDLFFNYQLMLQIDKAAVIEVPFYHYRYVPVSLSKTAPISRYMGCLAGLNRLVDWINSNSPECVGDIRRNFIFWCTKTCEQMLDDFHEDEFKIIQQYINESHEYIGECGSRIRILAKSILKSWQTYKFWGRFFLKMKKIYVGIIRLNG